MTFSNVKLILAREIRDQLRDRRTLFMIAVLPILLYPLLGMSLFQVSPVHAGAADAGAGGRGREAERPAAAVRRTSSFADNLFADPERARLLELTLCADEPPAGADADAIARADADREVQSGQYEAALYFPPDFASRSTPSARPSAARAESQRAAGKRRCRRRNVPPAKCPVPEIIYSTANDKSQIAFARLSDVLQRWTEQIGDDNLTASGVPTVAVRPFVGRAAPTWPATPAIAAPRCGRRSCPCCCCSGR